MLPIFRLLGVLAVSFCFLEGAAAQVSDDFLRGMSEFRAGNNSAAEKLI